MQNLTVRQLADILSKIPEEHKDLPIYAEYDAGSVHGLFEFDPFMAASDGQDTEFEMCVIIPGG